MKSGDRLVIELNLQTLEKVVEYCLKMRRYLLWKIRNVQETATTA